MSCKLLLFAWEIQAKNENLCGLALAINWSLYFWMKHQIFMQNEKSTENLILMVRHKHAYKRVSSSVATGVPIVTLFLIVTSIILPFTTILCLWRFSIGLPLFQFLRLCSCLLSSIFFLPNSSKPQKQRVQVTGSPWKTNYRKSETIGNQNPFLSAANGLVLLCFRNSLLPVLEILH